MGTLGLGLKYEKEQDTEVISRQGRGGIRTDAQQPESGPGRQEAEGGEGGALPG